MKLLREVCDNAEAYRRYLLIKEVTDDDAVILDLCNMKREPDFDEESDGVHFEAWMVM